MATIGKGLTFIRQACVCTWDLEGCNCPIDPFKITYLIIIIILIIWLYIFYAKWRKK